MKVLSVAVEEEELMTLVLLLENIDGLLVLVEPI